MRKTRFMDRNVGLCSLTMIFYFDIQYFLFDLSACNAQADILRFKWRNEFFCEAIKYGSYKVSASFTLFLPSCFAEYSALSSLPIKSRKDSSKELLYDATPALVFVLSLPFYNAPSFYSIPSNSKVRFIHKLPQKIEPKATGGMFFHNIFQLRIV